MTLKVNDSIKLLGLTVLADGTYESIISVLQENIKFVSAAIFFGLFTWRGKSQLFDSLTEII